MKPGSYGLTLVESITLAVVLLLVALYMLPFLARQRGSRSWSCRSTAKQMTLSVLMYLDDYDHVLPSSDSWRDALEPYHHGRHAYECPEDPRKARTALGSYAWNGFLSETTATKLLDAHRTVLFLETDTRSRNPVSRGGDFALRHLAGGTVGYLDGHVSSIPSASALRLEPVRKAVKRKKGAIRKQVVRP